VRIFLFITLFMSLSAGAQELDATKALLTILPAGDYSGVTNDGAECNISILPLSNRIAVIGTSRDMIKRSEIEVGSRYRWNPGTRSFLHTTLTTTLSDAKENVFRTLAVDKNKQYVVLADVVTKDRQTLETAIECIVDLK
jgi:hypothetical protein